MPDSRVTIHESTFLSRPCSNYTCRQAADKRKFFVGNPFGHSHKEIFCEDCINYLIANLPAEFVDGGANLETVLRESITKEYDGFFQEKLLESSAIIKTQLDAIIRNEYAGTIKALEDRIAELTKPDEVAAAIQEEKDPIYRCLDCGEEFDTPQKLGSHKRKHKDG